MKLALFDIDGTLTKANEVDNECLVRALVASHQITGIETGWTNYNYVTDSGIVSEIFNQRLRRSPNEKDFLTFKSCFIKNLNDFASKDETLFAEVSNSVVMLENLKLEKDWSIAFATGCFYDSAKLKLERAEIDIEDFSIGTADDAVSREEILQTAIEKSLEQYSKQSLKKLSQSATAFWTCERRRT